MTPPAAAAAPRTRTRRTTAPPRRVSGPARGKTRATTVTAPPPLALRIGGAVHGLAEHRFLDRILHGRAWIGILAVGLIGIVFMQVSMLQMNAGIGAAVEKAGTLERQNSALRADISALAAGERIAIEAAALGLVLPPGTPRFLDARGADARRAVASITLPGEGIVPSPTTLAAAEVVTPVTTTTPTMDQTGVVPEVEATAPPTTEVAAAPTTEQTTATTATDQSSAPVTSTTPPEDTGGAGAP